LWDSHTGKPRPACDEYRSLPQSADELGALLVVDSVATLAGVPVEVDRHRIDLCFSGTQKAISARQDVTGYSVSAP